MKLLGVVIQYNLKWDQRIDSMVAKANTRKYFITILKRSGVQFDDLVRCYFTFVRPLLEYAAPVWHPGLTIQQSDVLEQVHRQVLRVQVLRVLLTPVTAKSDIYQDYQPCLSDAQLTVFKLCQWTCQKHRV